MPGAGAGLHTCRHLMQRQKLCGVGCLAALAMSREPHFGHSAHDAIFFGPTSMNLSVLATFAPQDVLW
jgi:hypothetical protein